MRRSTLVRVVVGLAVGSVPFTANAQRHRRHHGGGGGDTTQQQTTTTPPAGGTGDSSGGMTFTTEDTTAAGTGDQTGATTTTTTDTTGGNAATPGAPTGDFDIGAPPGGVVQPQRHPLDEHIYAVEQIYALRNHRVETQLSVGASLNDPYVSHTGFGLAINYWVSNVLAVGINGVFFPPGGFNNPSDVNFHVARSTGLVVPINEYQLEAGLNFSYVPVYGKFSMFNTFIFNWDMYVMAGVGIMRTRPIAVVDPEVRTFSFDNRIMFNAGVGVRVFISRGVGIFGELRNYVYNELLENTTIPTQEGNQTGHRRDPNTWTHDTRLTDNVMVQVGLTLFFPFTFQYHLPK